MTGNAESLWKSQPNPNWNWKFRCQANCVSEILIESRGCRCNLTFRNSKPLTEQKMFETRYANRWPDLTTVGIHATVIFTWPCLNRFSFQSFIFSVKPLNYPIFEPNSLSFIQIINGNCHVTIDRWCATKSQWCHMEYKLNPNLYI